MADLNGLKSGGSTAATQGASQKEARRTILRKLGSREMPTYIEQVSAPNGKLCLVVVERLPRDRSTTDEQAAEYVREARAAASLQHANVVRGRAVGVRADEIVVACDFVDGERLSELWDIAKASGSTVPIDIAVRILVDALSGLGALHSLADANGRALELVHGDVTASNILVGADGVSRLLNTCRIRRPDASNPNEPCLSPEAASGKKIDARADIFAAGVLLWQSLRGRPVGSDSVLAAKIRAGTAERASAPKGASWAAPLANVAARAMALLPQDRYPSAAAMSAELQKIMTGKLPGHTKVAAFVQTKAGAKIEARRNLQPPPVASLPPAQPIARLQLQPDPSMQRPAIRIAPTVSRAGSPASQSQYSVTLRPQAGAPPAAGRVQTLMPPDPMFLKQAIARSTAAVETSAPAPKPAPPVAPPAAPKARPANATNAPPAAAPPATLPKPKVVVDWPSETPTMRPPSPPLVARGHSLPAGEAATPPVSERPLRVEPKVVIAVTGMPLAPDSESEPVPAFLDEDDLIDLETDPPSSGAAFTPRIPMAPQAPSFSMGSKAAGGSGFDAVRETPAAMRPAGEKLMPAPPSLSYSAPAGDVLRAERAFRARVIAVAVGVACVVVGSAALFRAWQTHQPTPAAIVIPAAQPVPVVRPEPVIPPAVAVEPATVPSEPAVVERGAAEPGPAESATVEAPAVAVKNGPAATHDAVGSIDNDPEIAEPAPVMKTIAPPAEQAPAPAPPATRRPKEPASGSAPGTSPALRPRFDPTKI